MTTKEHRDDMLEIMQVLLAAEPRVHYYQGRPMKAVARFKTKAQLLKHLKDGNHLWLDCSEAGTLICKLAGLQDPNGWKYGGWGNTQTILDNDNLQHYTNPNGAQVGAIVIFGVEQPLSKQHLCLVLEPGPDPLLWSHGQEAGPLKMRLSDERRFHPGPFAFVSIATLG